MSAGGARRGRRDNGLDASEYAVAGDVDPRVGEHLLDVLAAGGIAAYLQPSSDVNPVTRTTTVPARPVDRLFVDRAHLDTARGYLVQLAEDGPVAPGSRPGTPATGSGQIASPASDPTAPAGAGQPAGRDADVDAVWAGIIANYHAPAPADPTAAPWPAAENLPPVENLPVEGRSTRRDPLASGPRRDGTGGEGDGREPAGRDATERDATERGPADRAGANRDSANRDSASRDSASRDSDDAHGRAEPESTATGTPDPLPWAVGYTNISVGRRDDEPSLLDGLDTFGARLPDEPEEGYTPPLPPPLPRLSSAAVLGVLAIIAGFILFVFPTVLPVDRGLAILLGFAGVVGGFVTLIWRLRPDHDEDDDLDDGAVV